MERSRSWPDENLRTWPRRELNDQHTPESSCRRARLGEIVAATQRPVFFHIYEMPTATARKCGERFPTLVIPPSFRRG
jgi:hypothetical protein